MGDKIKKSPHIRFKGFTGDWEQRKLGEWGSFYYGHSCPKWSVTDEATTPCIRYGELYTKFGTKIDKVFSYTNMPSNKLRYSKGTEVLIPRVGENPMDYNRCTWLSIPDVAIGEMISVFNTEQNPFFTATMFNATLQKEFASRVEGGSVTNLYYEKLKNIDVLYPSLKEQEKMAVYFENMDNLINFHQRKLELLKVTKKSMVQKMFPKDGESVPEIRFAGFTDAWEQRKLGEVGDTFTGISGKTKEDFGHGDAKFVTYVNVFGNTISDPNGVESVEIDGKQNQVKYGDVFFTTSSETPEEVGMSSVWLENTENVYLNSFCFGYRPTVEFDQYYLAFMLRSPEIRKKFVFLAQGISRYNISKNKVMEMNVPVPELNEQRKVGTFFRNLDNLITFHQRELDLLKELKKSMLQQMFI